MMVKGALIILNLAILGVVIAVAVYIFQIGNRSRAVKCAAVESFGNSDISDAVTLGDGSRVKAYRSRGDESEFDKLPIFKFGDLAKRALEYKTDNPDVDVSLDFAIYQLQCGLWIGVDPDSDNYAAVMWDNCAGSAPLSGADKLIYTLVLAAQAGVNVRLIYQNPTEGGVWNAWGDVGNSDGLGGIYQYLLQDHDFLQTYGKTGTGTLLVRRPLWVNAYDAGQMHNKFMTVSHYKGDDGDPDYFNTVYTATANCKDEDRVQSGILVNGNEGLYNSYRKYFDLIWDNSVAIEDLEYDEWGDISSTNQLTLQVVNGGDSTRTGPVTLLSTTEYHDNFVAAVRACHDSDSNCSCACTDGTATGGILGEGGEVDTAGGACGDLSPSRVEDNTCHLYYQKGATSTRGTALDDHWCTQIEQNADGTYDVLSCYADPSNSTPIPPEDAETTCIYSDCCGGECEDYCSEYCQTCIKKDNICTTNTDCCSNSCVEDACADNPGGPSGLNYVGEFISAYFYPMSEDACTNDGVNDAWSEDQNAVVGIANLMSGGGLTDCEWTNIVYRWNSEDDFSKKLLAKLSDGQNNGCTNNAAVQSDYYGDIWDSFPGTIRSESQDDPYIHAKNINFHEGDNYTTISGSTNIKYYAVCSKGNNQILVKDKTIYDFFIGTATIAATDPDGDCVIS